ncbi:hypothetical protein NPIL_603231, partial [Nephila pilipes]
GLSLSKRTEPLITLHEEEIDIFSIMESDLASKNLKYYSLKGYSLYVLPKLRQVASSILIGVKKELAADFCIMKEN